MIGIEHVSEASINQFSSGPSRVNFVGFSVHIYLAFRPPDLRTLIGYDQFWTAKIAIVYTGCLPGLSAGCLDLIQNDRGVEEV